MAEGISRHARELSIIFLLSALGIVASAVYQLLAIRGLGPGEFAKLSAFVALINVVSIGSAALRNSVTVAVSGGQVQIETLPSKKYLRGGSLVEAAVLSLVGASLLVIASLFLGGSGGANFALVTLSSLIILPTFLFARAQGIIQGIGRPRDVVLWTTGIQLFQLLCISLLFFQSLSVGLVLGIMLIATLLGALGAGLQARRLSRSPRIRPFTAESIKVLLITVLFAWLLSVDVFFVAAMTEPSIAGSYAAGAVLVKTILLVPSTLMLYLLPRFVRQRKSGEGKWRGIWLTVAVTLVGALLMMSFFWLFGDQLVLILFGAPYDDTAALLIPMVLMWVPWAIVQTLLINLTAVASRGAVLALGVGAVAQIILALGLLPRIDLFLIANGILGLITMSVMLLIQRAQR